MHREPPAGGAGRHTQWTAAVVAGLFVAAVASGSPQSPVPPPPATQGDRTVRVPRPDSGGGTEHTADIPLGAPRAASHVIPGSRSVRPAAVGLPRLVYLAYRRAVADLAETEPGCHLPVSLLAAIGKVESGHARGGQVDASGTALHPIVGPALDGRGGLAVIQDTDGGVLDGDQRWDRAVGPMQFIPGTWRRWATDGNDDGVANPHNVFDAAAAAGRYLCANGRDLATEADRTGAILSYNNSRSYLLMVRSWMAAYARASVVSVDLPLPPSRPVDEPVGDPVEEPGSRPSDGHDSPEGRTGPDSPDNPNDPDQGAPVPAPPDESEPPDEPEPDDPDQPERPSPGDLLSGSVTGLVCVLDGTVDTVGDLLSGIGGLLGGPAASPSDETCPSPNSS